MHEQKVVESGPYIGFVFECLVMVSCCYILAQYITPDCQRGFFWVIHHEKIWVYVSL